MPISDGPFSGTGFSEELRNILYRIIQQADYRFSWYSLQHTGFPIYLPDTMFPDIPHKGATIKILGTRGNPNNLGADNFPKHYLTENPEAVLFMGDPTNIEPYINLKQQLAFPLYMYCTLDGLPVREDWIELLKNVNVLIAMTEWAQIEYIKKNLAPAYIHHGVNWYWWKPDIAASKILRQKYGIKPDETVFINWDVNQYRKRQDALLRCWRDFHPENKKAKLILYTDWQTTALGWDFERLIREYKIPRETVISPLDLQGSPKYLQCAEMPEKLLEIAMLGDVYVSTTSGEGFGKTSLEAMSLGMPVVITDYSACPEVCAKGSILVPTYTGQMGRFRFPDTLQGTERGIVNEEKFTEAMLQLYSNPNERKELGRIAREWAKEFNYDDKIVPKWIKLLDSINPDEILTKELLRL